MDGEYVLNIRGEKALCCCHNSRWDKTENMVLVKVKQQQAVLAWYARD